MAVDHAAPDTPRAGEYIQHHLKFLANKDYSGIIDFNAIHWDSVFFSVLLAVVFAASFFIAARRSVTTGKDLPGKFQNFVELIIEFVDTQVRDTFGKSHPFIAPLALTIFCWVFLFHFMDLLPVDLLPAMAAGAGLGYLKVVPSTDVNVTFALSITVLILIIYYS